jgi:hypothetical protein
MRPSLSYLQTHVAFQITNVSRYRSLTECVKNILIAKYSEAWRPISLLARKPISSARPQSSSVIAGGLN